MITFTIPSIYDALDLIMANYPHNFTDKNRVEVETLLDHCLEGISNDSEKFLTTLFIKAIKQFIGPGKIDENIYLKEFEIPQIELFNILIDKFPFVKHSQRIVNHSICNLATSRKELVVIDIGLGLGVQMVNLLRQLERSNLEIVTLIGIEPSIEALNKAELAIAEVSEELSYELNFIPINGLIEKLFFNELENTLADLSGDVVINASLALHHIQNLEQRQMVINNLYKLKPK
ncbi:MAG: GRAS family protein, partial [Bacteroidales bacterium]|nr:GRAS family protein [Bacteroidales bacterium]